MTNPLDLPEVTGDELSNAYRVLAATDADVRQPDDHPYDPTGDPNAAPPFATGGPLPSGWAHDELERD